MAYKVCEECGEIPEYNHRDFQPVACCPTKGCINHWPWTAYDKDDPIEWLKEQEN